MPLSPRGLWARILGVPPEPGQTAEPGTWPPPAHPLVDLTCDEALSVNPRTARGHRGEGHAAAERERQLETQCVLQKLAVNICVLSPERRDTVTAHNSYY